MGSCGAKQIINQLMVFIYYSNNDVHVTSSSRPLNCGVLSSLSFPINNGDLEKPMFATIIQIIHDLLLNKF